MKHHKQSEAAMLREVIAKKDAEIKDLNSMIEAMKKEIEDLTEKHLEECRQIARYDDQSRKDRKIFNALLEGAF